MNERIIITDGYTLNPGDLSWAPLNSAGKVEYYDRTPENLILERCKDATIIITNKTPLSEKVINGCDRLKMIAVTATGFNIVDVDAAKTKGVIVSNVPGYGTDSVAQHTFALILELTNHVGSNSQSVRDGKWSAHPDFCFTNFPLTELSGKVLGIVGFGKIGKKVAEIGKAFGMRIIFSASPSSKIENSKSLEDLFTLSDFVSLHCPLTAENKEFINLELLSTMKKNAFLINTARGQLINEHDLAIALDKGMLSGAALDVLSKEPPPENHPLLKLDNCIVTPHNAWCSIEARRRIMNTTFHNIEMALKGSPQNIV